MMKKNVYSVLVIGLFLLSCNNHCVQQIEPEERIQKGDILFVKLPMDYSIYDDSTTVSTKVADNSNNKNMNYIHVAILDVEKDDIWVIDATIKHGVDRYPLDTFLCDFTLQNGKYPTFEIMRLKDTSHIALYIEQAKKYIGCDYDVDFSLDNMAQYCSELVRNAYLSPDSEYIFTIFLLSVCCILLRTIPLLFSIIVQLLLKSITKAF